LRRQQPLKALWDFVGISMNRFDRGDIAKTKSFTNILSFPELRRATVTSPKAVEQSALVAPSVIADPGTFFAFFVRQTAPAIS
jgi:hypothetical protein